LLNDRYERTATKVRSLLHESRRVTICLDGWSKKGLTSSFLGISACFFDPNANISRHTMLSLVQLHHPHTGEALADALEKCLMHWDIPAGKVLLVICDNGANIVKAVRLMSARAEEQAEQRKELQDNRHDEDADAEDDDDEYNADEEDDDMPLNIMETVPYRRMACLSHTLQLVIKPVCNGHYDQLLSKVRHLVSTIRRSSVAVQKLTSKCGKTVITDVSTRWNSSYSMVKRFLEIKQSISEVLIEMCVDSLQVSEWCRLQECVEFLEPFAVQTNILQTDGCSLSLIVPSLIHLQCHLQKFPSKTLAKSVLRDFNDRFAFILDPHDDDFNPVPAAACLLDITVAGMLI
jgi:hypothetical protein